MSEKVGGDFLRFFSRNEAEKATVATDASHFGFTQRDEDYEGHKRIT
jgi:hypothetical protein